MTRIKNIVAYPGDTVITDEDYVIGSNGDTSSKTTQNYFFGDIRNYLLEGLAPEVGGTLKYTEIVNNSGTYTTPEDLVNALDPDRTVLQYEIVVITLNGDKYLLKLQDTTIGASSTAVTSSDFILLNVTSSIGTGAKIHKGLNATTGGKEFRSITKVGDLIVITENTNDVAITIDETELGTFIQSSQITYTGSNLGTGASVYKDTTSGVHRFKKLKSTDSSVTLNEGSDDIDFSINEDQGFVENGTTTTVSGDGTSASPYSLEINNLQKVVSSFPYTLVDADDKQTIFVENGASNVVINVPNGLVNNFTCAFIQKGTGTVTIQSSGTATVSYPSTTLQNIIKGQYYWAMVEKEIATDTYYLIGSLTLV